MLKQVIVIRTDTDMRKGKMCGQVGHAAISAFVQSMNTCVAPGEGSYEERHKDCAHTKAYNWIQDIQTKVVCKVSSEAELEAVARKAEAAGIITVRIHDAGHTQLDPNTFTCIGLGPDTDERLNPITGDLKLL